MGSEGGEGKIIDCSDCRQESADTTLRPGTVYPSCVTILYLYHNPSRARALNLASCLAPIQPLSTLGLGRGLLSLVTPPILHSSLWPELYAYLRTTPHQPPSVKAMTSLRPESITLDTFNNILSRYPASVPERLRDLDALRYDTIPVKVAKRKEDDDAFLSKDEVEKLVEWKLYASPASSRNSRDLHMDMDLYLKHGVFRPKLLQLVQSNPPNLIQSTIRKAFKTLLSSSLKSPSPSPLPSLKILTEIKGIGPATASLLLSVYAPYEVPFFSDELLRWMMWDEGSGWKRKIAYSVKEYVGLVERVRRVRERLGVGAGDVEKVAWVLGREGADVGVRIGQDEREVGAKGVEDGEVDEGKGILRTKGGRAVKGALMSRFTKKGTGGGRVVKKSEKRKKMDKSKVLVGFLRRTGRRKLVFRGWLFYKTSISQFWALVKQDTIISLHELIQPKNNAIVIYKLRGLV
ncbi:uncharacterized protein BDR25DRAFT_395579 [Lindgomyces ingoldianus]|uniref:Uncharacterized protein n=1 Tax=Lindgomyces ingoldianus TaxID=673940 RepID=A0ACB6QJE8_9PLEO|nr:uncharacterized protein BDR25DRAFT_395579 [Lindgomyces ingoldianus]KAF2467134.1 hypothetical protein BDR25DRAFT_395579 [Lindgomyces ingoldianus]